MTEQEILFALGFSLGRNSAFGPAWRQSHVQALPPSLRDWAGDELVRMMRECGEACGVWRVDRG
jgi:hypothetical protein